MESLQRETDNGVPSTRRQIAQGPLSPIHLDPFGTHRMGMGWAVEFSRIVSFTYSCGSCGLGLARYRQHQVMVRQ
ncbi:hypothetical protein OIU85_006555 [Salix viminalis]|uniref:Uncharacterized protein n=1 Tax=Salix viminalis TaxID=40686 RepID=A0A9Q0PLZ5_SALVM|nr:hypothetical protein OIU85_006555 [Salix viminalis]